LSDEVSPGRKRKGEKKKKGPWTCFIPLAACLAEKGEKGGTIAYLFPRLGNRED